MKIAYLVLNEFDNWFEDLSINPKGYGAGVVFARYLKEFDDFRVYARKECFKNVSPQTERVANCYPITQDQILALRRGEKAGNIITGLHEYDIICHCHTDIWLNTKGLKAIQVPWAAGVEQIIHSKHEHLIMYNDFQRPQGRDVQLKKVHKFTLGIRMPETPPIPDFSKKKSYDFFQCSRLQPFFGVNDLADFCHRHNRTVAFAGPMAGNDDLERMCKLPGIDYLGEIAEEHKIQMMKECSAYITLSNWDWPFNLSVIQALSLGTPVITTQMGFAPSVIENEINGFFVSNEEEFLTAVENLSIIDPRNCYKSVLQYNHFNMITSIYKCFKEILEYG